MEPQANIRLLELISQASSLEHLDIKVKLRLQEALFTFLRDEEKWLLLPRIEVEQLIKKLATPTSRNDLFTEELAIHYRDLEGRLISKKVTLVFDTFRNTNISKLFDQIINPDIAIVFQENFAFGMIEHLERLIDMEIELNTISKSSEEGREIPEEEILESESHTLSEEHLSIEKHLPPLSPQDLHWVRKENLGIMVQLIPRFVRIPLNKLYHAVYKRSPIFPSLTLQFYLSHYFASREALKLEPYSPTSQKLIRTFFSKAFYAIHRLGGLTVKELNLPEAKRFERYQYLTIDDEDPTPIIRIITTGVQRLVLMKGKLERLQNIEQNIRILKRRQYSVLMEVEMTPEKIIEDFFWTYRSEYVSSESKVDQLQLVSQTLWIPQEIAPMATWEREAVEEHYQIITSPEYLDCLPEYERSLIGRWDEVANLSCQNSDVLSMLEAINHTDLPGFRREVLLRLAKQHKLIAEQNIQLIFDQVGKQISRMLRMGTLTPALLIQQRYKDFQVNVLPYIYYFETKDENQNNIWVRAPFTLGKILYLIQILERPSMGSSMEVKGNPIDLSLTLMLLKEILAIEATHLDQPQPMALDPQATEEWYTDAVILNQETN